MEGLPSINVSNVLSEEKRQQVIALGRLGWSLRRIEKETGVRRETAGGYIRAAGIGLRRKQRAPPRAGDALYMHWSFIARGLRGMGVCGSGHG